MLCCDYVRSLIRNILVILPILGLTWVFGVAAVNSDLVAFQFIFAVANSLQVRLALACRYCQLDARHMTYIAELFSFYQNLSGTATCWEHSNHG